MAENLAALAKRGFVDSRWSCGITKRIDVDDRVFLLRQGREPRGIMASGVSRSKPYLDDHWDDNRSDKALYIKARLDVLLDPESDGVLPLSNLRDGALGRVNWRTQSSGISIAPEAAEELEKRWHKFLEERGQSPGVLPDEVSTPSLYYEGVSRTVAVNAYERDPRARKACIAHYGAICCVCGFDFGRTYGELGNGFIHVHHIVPLSKIGKGYAVNPIKDLRPVCPNCHAMLHKGSEVLSVEQLSAVLKKTSLLPAALTPARAKAACTGEAGCYAVKKHGH
ncbi:MAG: HNH endonuclease [Burkholderiales bacterium]